MSARSTLCRQSRVRTRCPGRGDPGQPGPQVLEKADLVDATERLKQLHGDLIHEALLSVDLMEAKLA